MRLLRFFEYDLIATESLRHLCTCFAGSSTTDGVALTVEDDLVKVDVELFLDYKIIVGEFTCKKLALPLSWRFWNVANALYCDQCLWIRSSIFVL